jgi:site-specific DNA recombinase
VVKPCVAREARETVTETTRCAVYARYSSEKQNSLTIDQQIRKCREYADPQGLLVLDHCIYADEAISGATDDRASLKRLLSAAREKPRPFDVVLVDDTSRMSRDLEHSLGIMKQLKFAGIRVAFISQGFDTSAPQSQTLLTVHGLVDSLYIEELAKKTFRGVEQLALNGLHTGGRVFGYGRVPIESSTERDSHGRPVIAGVKLAVDPNQAITVRRIFERYAAGDSMKRIAIDLNDEGILSPQPQKGRISRSWCPSSVRHILHNERYHGVVIWGKTQKVRSQETGKRIYRRKLSSEWRRRETPEQRIVSDELWAATRRRMQIVEKLYDGGPGERPRRARSAGSPYLFTGLLECSVCHGSVTIVSGQWRKRNDSRYGCSMHAYRGDHVCTNNLLIARMALEEQLLAGLQTKVLHPDVVEYTFRRFEEELARLFSRQGGETAAVRRRLELIERQIRNCTEAIASMGLSSALRTQLTDLEAEHRELTEKLAGSEPRAVRMQLRDTRRFVEAEIRNLQSMWTGEARLVRAEIAKHVEKITLTPEGRTYIAAGAWDLLGGVAVRMVPGARIAPRVCIISVCRWRREEWPARKMLFRSGVSQPVRRPLASTGCLAIMVARPRRSAS